MSDNVKITVKETGQVAEVNRSTAAEMVAGGYAVYGEPVKATPVEAPQQGVRK